MTRDLIMSRVGMRAPSAEVRFKDLYVQTEVYADLSRNLPSVLGFYRECIEVKPLHSFLTRS